MNTIYISCFAAIGVVVIAKLIYSKSKKNNSSIVSASDSSNGGISDQDSDSDSDKNDSSKEQNKPEMSSKNKWLYPSDEFGKMESGVQKHPDKS
ncbi:MAG: hypothetical protein HOH13_08615 [Crocinitomicaceae bacterium]|nr:hypothetical protein [Crocinitomicaceae bacterium]